MRRSTEKYVAERRTPHPELAHNVPARYPDALHPPDGDPNRGIGRVGSYGALPPRGVEIETRGGNAPMLDHFRSGVVRGFAVVLVVLGMAVLVNAPVAAQEDSVTIDLDELNDSGVSGEATLTADGDSTLVSIDVLGASGGHPAHIHEGTCDELNPNPTFPLTSVDADGLSETTVEVALDDLTADPYAINVHLSDTELGTYVTCGNITAAAVGGEEEAEDVTEAAEAVAEDDDDDDGVGGTTATTTPATGVGSLSTSDSLAMLAGLGAVALSLTAGGLALRRREVRS
ncbi:MAG: hypothetical protein ACRDJW_07550 [Thermomicrobiales bacterium]